MKYLIAFQPQGSNGPTHYENGTNMGAELRSNATQFDLEDAKAALKDWQSEAWIVDLAGDPVDVVTVKIKHEGQKHDPGALNALGIFDPKFKEGEKLFVSEKEAQEYLDGVAQEYYDGDEENIGRHSGPGWLDVDTVTVRMEK